MYQTSYYSKTKKDLVIEFHTKILSNTLLEPINKILKLKIKVNNRDIKPDELKDIIDNLSDPYDFPFFDNTAYN